MSAAHASRTFRSIRFARVLALRRSLPYREAGAAWTEAAVGPLQRPDGVVEIVDVAELDDCVAGVAPRRAVEAACFGAEQAEGVEHMAIGREERELGRGACGRLRQLGVERALLCAHGAGFAVGEG